MTKNIRKFAKTVKPYSTNIFVEQIAGIEPANLPWQGSILPLNYVCKFHKIISAINRPWAWQGYVLPLNYTCILSYLLIKIFKMLVNKQLI